MGKIVLSGPQNVSLDGVVQDPDGQEGFRLGGWFGQFGGKDLEEWNKVALAEALGAPRPAETSWPARSRFVRGATRRRR